MKKLIFALFLFLNSLSVEALPLIKPSQKNNVHKTSFDEIYQRYPSPFAVIQQLKRILPGATNYNCDEFNIDSTVFGINDPELMGPLESEPGALFYQHYQNCLRKYANQYGSSDWNKLFQEIVGSEEMPSLIEAEKYGSNIEYKNWSEFQSSSKILLMEKFIFYLIGPESQLKRLKYIGENNVFGTPLENSKDLAKFLIEIANKFPSADYLSRRSIYMVYIETAILLRLGPALKD